MTARLKKNIDMLKVLHKAHPQLRKAILRHLSTDTVRCICDCAHNILVGNLPLTSAQVKKLKKHKSAIRQLGSRKIGIRKKRQIIQRGGFISALLAPLLTLAVSLLAEKWKG